MYNSIKDLFVTLQEELTYHENILAHKKSLEATLWGLEEQASFAENSGQQDQTELNEQMNKCRSKVMSSNKLIESHLEKIVGLISSLKGKS